MKRRNKYIVEPIHFYSEEWKFITDDIIPFIKPYYYISTFGRVYSIYSNRFLNFTIDKDGYYVATFHLFENSGKYRNQICIRINRLVLLVFNPILDSENFDAHHEDRVKTNNYLWNLSWIEKENHGRITIEQNPFYNIENDYRNPRNRSQGERNGSSKLTDEDVSKIVKLLKTTNYSNTQIGKIFNVSDATISSIAKNNSWKHLQFNIDQSELKKSNSFSNDELDSICKFFNSVDINNKEIYHSKMDLFRDCFNKLGLDKKYDINMKRKTLNRILTKSDRSSYIKEITKNYDYEFIE